MPYTNYTFDFKGIIDYIFFSKPNMTPLGLLGPLDNNWLANHKIVGAPHPVIPSGNITYLELSHYWSYLLIAIHLQTTSHCWSSWK
jgi:mRNA deadenylase 3'-5' endonuclease subunit Ccr4